MSPKTNVVSTLVIGGSPRADLLPPEIKLSERLRVQRRWMVALLVLIVVVVAGGYAAAAYTSTAIAQQLATSQAQTLAILEQQKTYAVVNDANKQIATAQAARLAATATEIDWKTEISAVVATLPKGSTLTSLVITSSTPAAPLAAPSSPLEGDRVAEFNLTVANSGIPDTAKWIRELATLKGFVDATPVTIAASGGDGDLVTTSLVLHLNKEIFWGRFEKEVAK